MKRVRLTDEGSAVIRRLNAARFARLAQFVDTLSPGSTTSSPPPFRADAARRPCQLPTRGGHPATARLLAHRHGLVTEENSRWRTLGAMRFALFMIMLTTPS